MSQTINLSKHPIYFTSDTEQSLQYCTNKVLYKQVLCWALSHTCTACGKAWTVSPVSAALQCLELERENKHLCSTCTTKHFLRVTWLQLPMTDCYIGLILKTYHHLMIFFLFFFFLCKGEERGRDPVSNKTWALQLHWLLKGLAREISLNTLPALYNLTALAHPQV